MNKIEMEALRAEDLVKEKVQRVVRRIAAGEPDTAFRILDFIRTECRYEMSLIGTRITWLLAAQAFLVTGAVLAISNALNANVKHGVILAAIASGICIVGGVISIKTMGAVERAKCTIDLWHARIKDLYDSLGQMDEPSWLALILGRWTEFNEPFHQESLTLSNIVLPRIFTAFWAILFVSSLLLMIGLLRG